MGSFAASSRKAELVVAWKQLGLGMCVSAHSYLSSESKQGFSKALSFLSSFFFFLFLKCSKISVLQWKFVEKNVWIISVFLLFGSCCTGDFHLGQSELDPGQGGAECPVLSVWLCAVGPLGQAFGSNPTCLLGKTKSMIWRQQD